MPVSSSGTPLDEASWIWTGNHPHGESRVVDFRLEFNLAEAEEIVFDLSADQRFVLELDGVDVGRGPDRAELGGWSFHRYAGKLAAGEHVARVRCWWLSERDRPLAQVSARPGFALKRVGDGTVCLDTGHADWRAREVTAVRTRPPGKSLGYHVIGCGFDVDGSIHLGPWDRPAVVLQTRSSPGGEVATPWRLEPSPLAEQRRERFAGGRVRWSGEGRRGICGGDGGAEHWDGLARGGEVVVPAGTTRTWFWDFEDYVCGYPEVAVSGGAGSRIEIEWAESLFDRADADSGKGDRAACAGKHWRGFGDVVSHAGGATRYRIPWWRSGRWMRIVVRTAGEELILRDVRPLTTGYPYDRAWFFDCDQDLAPMLALCESGLRHCVHETFVDCPYYEQMQYLGDTRPQALTWLVAARDSRPVARALELFDRSRWVNGFHAERCPTAALQMSATYSLIYPRVLRDYAWWRDDPETVRARLPGMRGGLEAALACLDASGLPRHLPGWLFVDWVREPEWTRGCPRGSREGLTAPVALHLPVALDAAAEVEEAHGESLLARRWREASRKAMEAILQTYFDEDAGCFRDDPAGRFFSEHAQALALASPSLPEEKRDVLVAWLDDPPEEWAKATVYFSHHVHEALLAAGNAESVLRRFDFWRQLTARGFTTTVERPEPSRSDCHGWGAHPLYHCLSGLAGIRPDAPGFRRVALTPRFGPLQRVEARCPHPAGEIEVRWRREDNRLSGEIRTPVPGVVVWGGKRREITAGMHRVEMGGI